MVNDATIRRLREVSHSAVRICDGEETTEADLRAVLIDYDALVGRDGAVEEPPDDDPIVPSQEAMEAAGKLDAWFATPNDARWRVALAMDVFAARKRQQ